MFLSSLTSAVRSLELLRRRELTCMLLLFFNIDFPTQALDTGAGIPGTPISTLLGNFLPASVPPTRTRGSMVGAAGFAGSPTPSTLRSSGPARELASPPKRVALSYFHHLSRVFICGAYHRSHFVLFSPFLPLAGTHSNPTFPSYSLSLCYDYATWMLLISSDMRVIGSGGKPLRLSLFALPVDRRGAGKGWLILIPD